MFVYGLISIFNYTVDVYRTLFEWYGSAQWATYVARLVLLRAHIRIARNGHVSQSLVHRTLMAELRFKFKRESIEDRKKVKALQCLRFVEHLSKHSSKFLMSPSSTFFNLRNMRANQFYLR